jgi:hypothetical protein
VIASHLPQRRRLPCQKQWRRPSPKPGGASITIPGAEADGQGAALPARLAHTRTVSPARVTGSGGVSSGPILS